MGNKKIYFACSIRGGRNDAETYAKLVSYINTRADVLSEIFANNKLTSAGSSGLSKDIYAKDIAWVERADAIIAEVTTPSLGVGYEIAKAEEWGKPVLALFRQNDDCTLSAMIDGSPCLKIARYSDINDVKPAIDRFIHSLK